MLNRRKHPRCLLHKALDGTLRLTEDVVVESYASSEITVVSGLPARSHQCLALAAAGTATPTPFDVVVTESTPAVVDGVLKHRLRLRLANRHHVEPPRMLGALVRDVRVRVLDISAGGCLLEAGTAIAHGTGGQLAVSVDGESLLDALRVCRCQLVEGAGSVFRLGAQFSYPANGGSLRGVILGKTEPPAFVERALEF